MKENNFEGTQGEWVNCGGDAYTIDIVLPDTSVISFDIRSRYSDEIVGTRDKMNANAELIADAGNVRQQINCSLPELLERYKRMEEALKLIDHYFRYMDDEDVDDPRVRQGDLMELLNGLLQTKTIVE